MSRMRPDSINIFMSLIRRYIGSVSSIRSSRSSSSSQWSRPSWLEASTPRLQGIKRLKISRTIKWPSQTTPGSNCCTGMCLDRLDEGSCCVPWSVMVRKSPLCCWSPWVSEGRPPPLSGNRVLMPLTSARYQSLPCSASCPQPIEACSPPSCSSHGLSSRVSADTSARECTARWVVKIGERQWRLSVWRFLRECDSAMRLFSSRLADNDTFLRAACCSVRCSFSIYASGPFQPLAPCRLGPCSLSWLYTCSSASRSVSPDTTLVCGMDRSRCRSRRLLFRDRCRHSRLT